MFLKFHKSQTCMMPENMYSFNAFIFMPCNCSFELSSMMFIMSFCANIIQLREYHRYYRNKYKLTPIVVEFEDGIVDQLHPIT